MPRWLLAVALAAALLGGCGGGGELSEGDANQVAQSREDLDDAIDTTEALRTSKAEAR